MKPENLQQKWGLQSEVCSHSGLREGKKETQGERRSVGILALREGFTQWRGRAETRKRYSRKRLSETAARYRPWPLIQSSLSKNLE